MSAKIIPFPSSPSADDALCELADTLGWPSATPLCPMYANEDEALRDELTLIEDQLKELQERRDEIISMIAKRERAP